MKNHLGLFVSIALLAIIVLAACGGAAPAATQAPALPDFSQAEQFSPAATEAPALEEPVADQSSRQALDAAALPAATSAAF